VPGTGGGIEGGGGDTQPCVDDGIDDGIDDGGGDGTLCGTPQA